MESARSEGSTPSLLPSGFGDVGWEQQMGDTKARLEEARVGYKNELKGSGIGGGMGGEGEGGGEMSDWEEDGIE